MTAGAGSLGVTLGPCRIMVTGRQTLFGEGPRPEANDINERATPVGARINNLGAGDFPVLLGGTLMKLRHGGRLRAATSAIRNCNGGMAGFFDSDQSAIVALSSDSVWQRLPKKTIGLQEAIHQFYGRGNGLAVRVHRPLLKHCRRYSLHVVYGCQRSGIRSMPFAGKKRGQAASLRELPTLSQLAHGDIVVVIESPNNPTAELPPALTLIDMAGPGKLSMVCWWSMKHSWIALQRKVYCQRTPPRHAGIALVWQVLWLGGEFDWDSALPTHNCANIWMMLLDLGR